jgi:hypothetical protein
LYSIPSADALHCDALGHAQQYYANTEFAYQLCNEFAAAESSDPKLRARLRQASDALKLIVDHNTHLQTPPSQHQPAWPRHEALLRFDLPLHLLQSGTWTLRDFSLQDSFYLHHSDDKNEQPVGFRSSVSNLFWRTVKYITPTWVNCTDLRGARALLSHLYSACVTPLHRLQRRRLQRGSPRTGVRL